MKADGSAEVDRSGNVPADLTSALIAALGWSCEIAVRLGHAVSAIATFAAALGCTAFTLGSVAVVARRSRTAPKGFDPLVIGALLASGPTSLLGSVIAGKTHHRALGGVTFAFVAAALVVGGALIVRRVFVAFPRASRGGTMLRLALTILVVSSMGIVILPLLRELGAPGSESGHRVAEDLLVGAGFAAVVALPDWKFGARIARVGAGAWALSVAVGVSALAVSMPLRATLAGRAPVALGPLGLGVVSAAPFQGIPPAVDVSLH